MDRRIEKTKQSLEHALFFLCTQKELQDITVSELCKQAGVNRTTFYKYYSVPEDVMQQRLDRLLEDQIMQFTDRRNTEDPNSFQQAITKTLAMIKEEQEAYTMFISINTLQASMLKKFIQVLRPEEEDTHRIYFLSGGMSALIAHWVSEGFIETPKEMAKIICNYIQEFM